VPGLGEGYLTQRRRRTTAEQTVRRVLGVCCVDPSRVPPEVVEAHIDLTERLDRASGDAAYLRSARSLSMIMARPATTVARLGRVRQPALLLQGARDRLVPLASARRMQASHPDWRLEVAADIGHVPMLEAPTWTASMIEGWLAERGAPPASASPGSASPGSASPGSVSVPAPASEFS
jgi:pimeloyl-ACP methyl ester carboxylesterase